MGLDLAGIDNRVVVKLPITDAGIEAAALLKKQGVLVTMTGQNMHRSNTSHEEVLVLVVCMRGRAMYSLVAASRASL